VSEVQARDAMRLQEIEKLKAQSASVQSDERRYAKLVSEGVAPAAMHESLQHQLEAIAADIRAREKEKDQLAAEGEALQVRLEKIRRFEKEQVLASPSGGVVLTRHHRMGEWIEPGQAIVTLQIETPYLRVEVPEERLSAFVVGRTVTVWPQARPDARFQAKIVSIKPRSEFATRKNWGLQSRDLQTFSVRLQPLNGSVVSGQAFVVEAGSGPPKA
jgi:multidrug resistance efflux pump